jgi:hypothetical protein
MRSRHGKICCRKGPSRNEQWTSAWQRERPRHAGARRSSNSTRETLPASKRRLLFLLLFFSRFTDNTKMKNLAKTVYVELVLICCHPLSWCVQCQVMHMIAGPWQIDTHTWGNFAVDSCDEYLTHSICFIDFLKQAGFCWLAFPLMMKINSFHLCYRFILYCSRSCCPMWNVVAAYAGESSYCMKLNWLFLGPAVMLWKLHNYFVKLSSWLCSLPLIC